MKDLVKRSHPFGKTRDIYPRHVANGDGNPRRIMREDIEEWYRNNLKCDDPVHNFSRDNIVHYYDVDDTKKRMFVNDLVTVQGDEYYPYPSKTTKFIVDETDLFNEIDMKFFNGKPVYLSIGMNMGAGPKSVHDRRVAIVFSRKHCDWDYICETTDKVRFFRADTQNHILARKYATDCYNIAVEEGHISIE